MFDDVNKLALVKELKDAGFPLKPATMGSDAARIKSFGYEGIWLFPTLEELLEEMPMRRKDLGTVNDAHFVLRKLVGTNKNSYWAYIENEDTYGEIEGYSFRNEPADVVVARLWLALNKK